MYCNPISQSYNSENAIMKLFHLTPESHSVIALNLNADKILYYLNAPLLLQIWALT